MHWSKNPEMREKIISRIKAKRTGTPAWNKGIPASDEAKEKNRQKHLGKKPSEQTRNKMRESHEGIIHDGLFKKNLVPWNKGRLTTREIVGETRERIIERDGCCKICGRTDRLEIHHINPFEKSHDNSEQNLVVLCKHCHMSLHMKKRNERPYEQELLK